MSRMSAVTYIRCPSVCPSLIRAVNTRQHIRMYSVYAVVCPSVSHTRASVKTVKFSQCECITSIRVSISHTVDITFTACRQHCMST